MGNPVALFLFKKYFKKNLKKFEKPIDKRENVCYNRAYPKGNERKEVQKMKILKNILNWFMLLVGAKSELTDEAVNEAICDFGGQGRNEYGK